MEKNGNFPASLKTRKIFRENPLDPETEKNLEEIKTEKHLLELIESLSIDEFPREQVALIRCALYSALEELGFELIDKDQLIETSFHEEDIVIIHDSNNFRYFLPLLTRAFSLGFEHLNSSGQSIEYVGAFLEFIYNRDSYYFKEYKIKEKRKEDFLFTCLYTFNMTNNPPPHQQIKNCRLKRKKTTDSKEIKERV